MCNIAPVLTRTGVFYVVKTLVPQPREWQTSSWQTTSEVADHSRQTTSEVADHPANDPEVADHHKKDKEKTV